MSGVVGHCWSRDVGGVGHRWQHGLGNMGGGVDDGPGGTVGGVVGDRGGCVVVGHRGQVGGETCADRLVGGEGSGGGNHLVGDWGNVLLMGDEGGGRGNRHCRAAHCMLGNCGNWLVGCEGCTRGNNWGN